MNVMEQGNQFVPYYYKIYIYSTKNVELAMWVWVVWEKCGKELCGETMENNNMGKMWKNYEKKSVENNSVGKLWKICEMTSVEKMWKRIL
jgi:hypothetical protein